MLKNHRFSPKLWGFLLSFLLFASHFPPVLAAPPPPTGKLITTSDLPVLVNGNNARGGATVLSGSLLETPANAAAFIQLGNGDVEFPPDSLGLVEFNSANIKITLKRGCAVLTTKPGVTGSIVNEKGAVLHTNSNAEEGVRGASNHRFTPGAPATSDGKLFRRLPVCDLTGNPVAPVPPNGLSGAFLAALVALMGGPVIIGGIITGGGNPSPA